MREWLFLLLLPFLLALAYSNSLQNGWHFDDIPTILENEHIRSLGNTPSFFTDPQTFSGRQSARAMYRPLLLLSYALTYTFGQYDLFFWHLTQLLLHLICGVLVYIWVRQLIVCQKTSLFCAAVFLLHPIQSQAVNYLSSRSEIQVSLFYLLCLICWIHYRTVAKKNLWRTLSLLAFAGGLLTKSIAITIPFVITLWEWWLCPMVEKSKDRVKIVAPFYILLFLFFALRILVVGALLFPGGEQHTPLFTLTQDSELPQYLHFIGGRSFLTNLKMQGVAFWSYLRLLLWPSGLSIFHHIDPQTSALPLLAATAFLLIMVILRNKAPLFSFGGLFFILLLSPTSLIPLNLVMNEHRVYLASLGIFIPLAHRLFKQKRLSPKYPAVVLVLLCTFLTRARNPYWANSVALFGQAVKVAPRNRFVHYEYGYALLKEGFVEEAVNEFEKEAQLFPKQRSAFWAALGRLNLKLGKLKRARQCLDEALAKDKNCPRAAKLAQQLGKTQ